MTHTIEVLQEDIDNAVSLYFNESNSYICVCRIIDKALNRIFKEEFKTSFNYADSNKRKLVLTDNPRHSFMTGREWKNVKPFTFTATEH